jgi:FAD-dependent urate hydroxylase
VPIRLGRSVKSAKSSGDRVRVVLDEGSERVVDHVLLGTGYRVDISKYKFLSENLKASMSCFEGFPILRAGLETSVVDRLHIFRARAAWSFGPLLQFVPGTHHASQALTRHILGQARSRNFSVLTAIVDARTATDRPVDGAARK